MAKRPALGSDPLDLVLGGESAGVARKRGPAASKSKRVRAQLNVLFPSWESIDWCRAAAYIKRVEQREILGAALELYKKSLPAAERREIEAQALAYAKQREKGKR